MTSSDPTPTGAQAAPTRHLRAVADGDVAMDATELLTEIVTSLPGGQTRVGQEQMATAIEAAISGKQHALVEAPTGTGKSLAYLAPLALHAKRTGRPVVVATATKALQAQLVDKDLPRLAAHLPGLTFALLKGRSNFACLSKLSDLDTGGAVSGNVDLLDLERLREWALESATGDRDDAPVASDAATWGAVSVGRSECPGADRCPFGAPCFAEQARERAFAADVIVTNTAMYLMHLLTDGNILPDHDVVVFDEAHTLADSAASAFGAELHPGRFGVLAARIATFAVDRTSADELRTAADDLDAVLAGFDSERVNTTSTPLAGVLEAAARALRGARAGVDRTPVDREDDDQVAAKHRLLAQIDSLWSDVAAAQSPSEGDVTWVENTSGGRQQLRVAPLDVGPDLRRMLFDAVDTVVLTSATLAVGGQLDHTAHRVGLRGEHVEYAGLVVDTPFDYPTQSLLYVPTDLPEPRDPSWSEAARQRTLELIEAAGGRTLALFTSWRNLDITADWLSNRLGVQLLVQGQLPHRELVERFTADETSVLCATRSFWEGIDAVGATCSLVVIDKLPFPHRNDPLLAARRDAAGDRAFNSVDLPHAAILLAQGAGRLIRSVDDRGVVAVLDPRLAAKSYRRVLLDTMPPMRRTITLDEVREFLTESLLRSA